MAQELVTFLDITNAICEQLGVQTSDARAVAKIKRFINMVYLDEVVPFKRWTWLENTTQIIHEPYNSSGTAAATNGSTTITLSANPSAGLGSFEGFRFSLNDSNQVYTVASHTPASPTVVLTTAFQESTNATANYKIWRDRIDLPQSAKETIEIWHSQLSVPVKAIGPQRLRQLEAAAPKAEGHPQCYNTWEFFNPDSPDPETDATRYRQTRVYPSINSTSVVLNVDYIQKASPLEDDIDEPLIPIGDRSVLYYGAGALAWSSISRNEEMHDKWYGRFQMKLGRMAAERDDGYDTPALAPTTSYINSIRRSGLKSRRRRW